MARISVYDLYSHLTVNTVSKCIDCSDSYQKNLQTEADKLYLEDLNNDADLLLPVMSNGHRMNDVDSIKTLTNPVARDILVSRLQPLGVDPTAELNQELSDREIADLVVSKDSTLADIVNQIGDMDDYVNEGVQMDTDAAAAAVAAAAAAVPAVAVDPNPTE